jgi:chromosome partitioning protein
MIVVFAGQKGGTGKSTTALCVAAEWHAQRRRVLLVDADPQGTIRTWGDVAAEQGADAPTVVAMGQGLHKPGQLPALATKHDHTVIDTPPRLGEIQRAALTVADLVVLPCGPSTADAWALVESVDMVRKAQELRPSLIAAVLITRKVSRTAVGAAARKVLADSGLPVLKTELGYRVAYQESLAAGLGVTAYEPSGEAAREIRHLVKELERYGQV